MFFKQRDRLLRKEGWTADQLAQELWTMFGPDVATNSNAPLSLTKNGNNPAIYLNGFQTGDILISVRGRQGELLGNLTFQDGTLKTTDAAPATNPNSSGGGGIPGQILSGSGTTYQVKLYPSGLAQASQTKSVRQLQIEGSEALKTGDWVVAFASPDGTYFMQAERGIGECILGKVVSGTGATYSVNLYPDGLSGATVSVSATALGADATTPMKADALVRVTKNRAGTYYLTPWVPAQTFAGKVVSGSGASYQVTVYPNGTGETGVTVSTTQLQIDSGDTVPADTYAIVTRDLQGTYSMQVPVWLE